MAHAQELWVDAGGVILCLDHLPDVAKAAVVGDPRAVVIRIGEARWAHLGDEDRTELETVIGVLPDCEECAYQRFIAKVLAKRMAVKG